MQYLRQQQQRRRWAIQQCPHVPRRSVAASDDTWRIEMKSRFRVRSYALLLLLLL